MKISVLTLRVSKPISIVQGLKRAVNYEVNQHIGRSREGNTTKIHAIVDGLGNLIYFALTAGSEHDCVCALDLLSKVNTEGSNILADKAYGSLKIREYITSRKASYTIPPKSNAKEQWEYDKWLYIERHLIECFFNKIKHFRKLATRYDKLATSFLAFIYCAAIFILCK